MRDIRPYDQSLALKAIARGSASAFHRAVMDESVREYLISQRSPHSAGEAAFTVAWANGFVRNTEAFLSAIRETGESPDDLATLSGLPPAGMDFIQRAKRAAPGGNGASLERLAALLSYRTESALEVEVLWDVLNVVGTDAAAYSAVFALGKPPLQVLMSLYDTDYDGDLDHLYVHLAYRRVANSPTPVEEVIRLTALGLIDPVTLEHAATERWPDEYAYAFDSDRG